MAPLAPINSPLTACVCVCAPSLQVAVNVQSVDELHDPAVLAINAASTAVCTSPLEWRGPVGAVRVVVSSLTDHSVVWP